MSRSLTTNSNPNFCTSREYIRLRIRSLEARANTTASASAGALGAAAAHTRAHDVCIVNSANASCNNTKSSTHGLVPAFANVRAARNNCPICVKTAWRSAGMSPESSTGGHGKSLSNAVNSKKPEDTSSSMGAPVSAIVERAFSATTKSVSYHNV